jgi:non-ribosomal peptide synthetase component F
MGELLVPIGIEQPQMKAMERRYRLSRNEFFITVAALAISIYNRKNDIKLCWIYNGREDMTAMNSVGLLFRELPVGVRLKEDMTLRELFADVHEQVQKGIEHCCYPYVDLNNQAGSDEAAYLLYQRDIRDMGGVDGMDVETIDIRQNQAASQTVLDMEILDGEDGLILMIDYTASLYEDYSMDEFKDIFIRVAQGLVTHNSQNDVTVGELQSKYRSKLNFFETFKAIFGRKK